MSTLQMKYAPKEDITVYELAILMPFLIFNTAADGHLQGYVNTLAVKKLPDELQRHFAEQ